MGFCVRFIVIAACTVVTVGAQTAAPTPAASPRATKTVVLQVSNADKVVAERLSCVLRLPNRKGCR
jgi:hypothetical protein